MLKKRVLKKALLFFFIDELSFLVNILRLIRSCPVEQHKCLDILTLTRDVATW